MTHNSNEIVLLDKDDYLRIYNMFNPHVIVCYQVIVGYFCVLIHYGWHIYYREMNNKGNEMK